MNINIFNFWKIVKQILWSGMLQTSKNFPTPNKFFQFKYYWSLLPFCTIFRSILYFKFRHLGKNIPVEKNKNLLSE